ncbi:MAG: 50S ribosomal protein L15 [Pyrinomonadaceae bacterium]|nr:50S ribosomal protein L15 [Pyrinomonadaceae bacterium]
MSLSLNKLKPAKGSTHKKKRRGRGPGSGLGKTAGRGHKGQKSRSGYSRRAGFEGGQMPLQRRLPKRGFTNIFKKKWIEVRLSTLESNFNSGDEVTPEILHDRGLIKKAKHDLVILGNGELTKKLNVSSHRFTKSAKAKIEGAGGSAVVIEKAAAKKADSDGSSKGSKEEKE